MTEQTKLEIERENAWNTLWDVYMNKPEVFEDYMHKCAFEAERYVSINYLYLLYDFS